MAIKIPVYQPSLSGNEKKYVNDCLDSTWISSKGKYISMFETEFAKSINVKHAASVSNGTVALHLALVVLGIGPGDEVIVPTLTYIASVNAITYTGATPVFVDSLPDTWQMDPEDVKRKITKSTKAIMAVHLYGQACEMDTLIDLSKKNNIYLIEDCAEAYGTLYKNNHVGTFGAVSTFSFFGNKTITTGEGGMVVTNDDELYRKSVHYKGQGLAANREYWHDVIGYNYRMTNICAAIGLAQLEQAGNFIEMKRSIAQWYKENLKDTPVSFHKENKDIKHTYWMCSALSEKEADRDPLRKKLADAGIETRPLFYPVHTMPIYSHLGGSFPVAENLAARGINLPSYPGLSKQEVEYICNEIRDFYKLRS